VFATTPWYEPYGLTPLEAMACGTPAVCSAVGGITLTVDDGVTGFLVPPRRPDVLAGRLAMILGDDGLRDELGRNARRRVIESFTWSTVAHRTAEVYAELIHATDISPS
jgi:glycosyltransferase involved in cell wall biosynthesis